MITKKEFEAVKEILESGMVNMNDIRVVSELSDVQPSAVREILEKWPELEKRYA